MAFCYDRTDYYTYLLNLQGDVIAILDSNYNVVVEYTYSAYGQVMSVTGSLADTIGQINPLRYRGYYYDVETGFYYLNSRYYDPVVGRFLSPDSFVASTGDGVNGLNMYAYCFNNPVNLSDSSGNWPTWDDVCSFLEGAIITIAKPFEARVGLGFGIGGNVSDNVKAEFSRDSYIGIDDGMLVTGNVVTAELSVADIGFGDTYDRRVEENGVMVSSSGSLTDGPFAMINYPDVTHGNQFALGPLVIDDSGDVLISASVSGHLILGGHASIAYNFTELFEGIFS